MVVFLFVLLFGHPVTNALMGVLRLFVIKFVIMFIISIPNHATGIYPPVGDCAVFDTLDDALLGVTDVIDDTCSDCVIRVYDDDTVVAQYRGRMQRVGVDYDDVDFGPVI